MSDLHFAEVNGVRLAYQVSGDADAPPLLLLHGRGADHSGWKGVIDRLAGSWRVYAPDLRGHGRSDWPGAYDLELMRDDMVALLGHAGVARTAIVAHSLGGFVGFLIAEEHPGLVDRLVLEDVPAPHPAGVSLPDRPESPLSFDWAMVEQTTHQRNHPDPAWLDRLADITAPTLVIAGGATSHLPQDQVADLASRIPGCRIVTIEGGHDIHTTRPDEFLDAVTTFLRR
ncbi:alpha/beta hydrolase [Planotetraspora sp. A-T 1434]|uniref:alpha/beta fold hydrolase n=1 Tax=Planotetraspora sp. A-T 1434 TaxID=2979219 RepID=UPI0021C0BBB3|nr:alpha/beta hydrolase [Planotetraspora sp. A-T 1434]MCT9930867.1 alpha/beta hydrolase [Planotetraspora sp. A-T 1434]